MGITRGDYKTPSPGPSLAYICTLRIRSGSVGPRSLHRHTSELLRAQLQATAVKQVITFLPVEGLAFHLLKRQHLGTSGNRLAIKQGLPVLRKRTSPSDTLRSAIG